MNLTKLKPKSAIFFYGYCKQTMPWIPLRIPTILLVFCLRLRKVPRWRIYLFFWFKSFPRSSPEMRDPVFLR